MSVFERVCVCTHSHVHLGAVRRPGHGTTGGDTTHMRKMLFMQMAKKNHAAPRHDR